MKIILREETVTFRDGSKLELRELDWISALKASELEEAIRAEIQAKGDVADPDEKKRDNFALYFYPKMAASCANGLTPTLDEALSMPATEIMKWYEATRRVNPDLFQPVSKDESQTDGQTKEQIEEQKKKEDGRSA